jgi:hypothetical protein
MCCNIYCNQTRYTKIVVVEKNPLPYNQNRPFVKLEIYPATVLNKLCNNIFFSKLHNYPHSSILMRAFFDIAKGCGVVVVAALTKSVEIGHNAFVSIDFIDRKN